jgi:hypothetical protein
MLIVLACPSDEQVRADFLCEHPTYHVEFVGVGEAMEAPRISTSVPQPNDPNLYEDVWQYLDAGNDACGSSTNRRCRNQPSNQAMQLTASKSAIYAWSGCHRASMLRGMHRGLAAADLVSR